MAKIYTLKNKRNPETEVEPSIKELNIEDIERIVCDKLEDFEADIYRILESTKEEWKQELNSLVEKIVLSVLDNRGLLKKEAIDSVFACPLCGRVYDWRKVKVETKHFYWAGKVKKHKDCPECEKAILVYEKDGGYWRTISKEEGKKGKLLKDIKHKIVYREVL